MAMRGPWAAILWHPVWNSWWEISAPRSGGPGVASLSAPLPHVGHVEHQDQAG